MKYIAAFLHKYLTSSKWHFSVFHFEKRKTAFNSGFFLLRCYVWHGMKTVFFVIDQQNAESSRFAVRWPFFFFEIILQVAENIGSVPPWPFLKIFSRSLVFFFWDRHCEKTASQSLSYGIFAKTSGHYRIFFGTYAEGEKLEGTLLLYEVCLKSKALGAARLVHALDEILLTKKCKHSCVLKQNFYLSIMQLFFFFYNSSCASIVAI